MKKLFLILFIANGSLLAVAQGIIRGRVVANNKETLPGAHILVNEISAGAITDEQGNFLLKNINPGTYTVAVSFIGYESQSQIVEVTTRATSILKFNMEPANIQLGDLVVSSSADHVINTLTPLDIKLRPTNTSQDILRMVPGLFIAQHAGGGKAEQIFLRGFDIDHGTDLNLEVDGLPVNMVSHAHGQGYSDLHFVIPEMVGHVDFNKGPYYADKGNFTTAGYAAFHT